MKYCEEEYFPEFGGGLWTVRSLVSKEYIYDSLGFGQNEESRIKIILIIFRREGGMQKMTDLDGLWRAKHVQIWEVYI